MSRYIVYELTTGRIERYGTCPPDQVGLQAKQGYAVTEGEVINENFVIDGKPVYIPPPPPPDPTAEQIAAKTESEFARDIVFLAGKAFFNHENRLRILEGKIPITWEQFKAAIRGMS